MNSLAARGVVTLAMRPEALSGEVASIKRLIGGPQKSFDATLDKPRRIGDVLTAGKDRPIK